ncbi:MAG: hypothetical protein D6702_00275 [Planctomycetota bacterium]|nr:MAG: hypothetical protein D6702_00275 [Planctomycetota bacterium]
MGRPAAVLLASLLLLAPGSGVVRVSAGRACAPGGCCCGSEAPHPDAPALVKECRCRVAPAPRLPERPAPERLGSPEFEVPALALLPVEIQPFPSATPLRAVDDAPPPPRPPPQPLWLLHASLLC